RHAYAPVADTPPEMHRLVAELSSEDFEAAHPILQASYAHYVLTAVHPFADGNGRVARAVASTYLYRAARVPLIIFPDDRDPYLQALARADSGTYTAFVHYVSEAAVASVELILEALETQAAPAPSVTLDAFRQLLTVQGDLTHTDIDALANSLLMTHFLRVVNEEIAKLSPPSGVGVSSISGSGSHMEPPAGFRGVVSPSNPFVGINSSSAAPSQAARVAEFRVFISTSADDESDLFWLLQPGTDRGVGLALRDVRDRLTAAAEHRLRLFVQRVLGTELSDLLNLARESLRGTGYPVRGDPQ